jgi:hypothetical protein
VSKHDYLALYCVCKKNGPSHLQCPAWVNFPHIPCGNDHRATDDDTTSREKDMLVYFAIAAAMSPGVVFLIGMVQFFFIVRPLARLMGVLETSRGK